MVTRALPCSCTATPPLGHAPRAVGLAAPDKNGLGRQGCRLQQTGDRTVVVLNVESSDDEMLRLYADPLLRVVLDDHPPPGLVSARFLLDALQTRQNPIDVDLGNFSGYLPTRLFSTNVCKLAQAVLNSSEFSAKKRLNAKTKHKTEN